MRSQPVLQSSRLLPFCAILLGIALISTGGRPLNAQTPSIVELTVQLLDPIDSAQAAAGQRFRAAVANDSTIVGVFLAKGTPATITLAPGAGGSGWTLKLIEITVRGKVAGVLGLNPVIVPSAAGNVSRKAMVTRDRIAIAAGENIRFNLGPAPASGSSAPATAAKRVAGPAGPPNDMLANRIRLSGLEAHSPVNNANATVESGEPPIGMAPGNDKSIWWEYTPPENGKVTIDFAGTQIDLNGIGVFGGGTTFKDMVPICRDRPALSHPLGQIRFEFQGKKGEPYIIGATTGPTGIIQVNVRLTPNDLPPMVLGADNFADRRSLEGATATGQVDNRFFGPEGLEPRHTRSDPGASAWWKWKAPANGYLYLDSIGTGAEGSLIAVYVGEKLENLTPVARVDDLTDRAKLKIPVKAGVEYQIARGTGPGVPPANLRTNLHFIAKAIPDPWIGTDAFDDRPKMSGSQALLVGNSLFATLESGEPTHICVRKMVAFNAANANTIWWGWTAPANGHVTIDALDSEQEVMTAAAYSGTSIYELTKVAQDYDGLKQFKLEFDAKAGVSYAIVANAMDGRGNQPTNVTLHLVLRPGVTGLRKPIAACQ